MRNVERFSNYPMRQNFLFRNFELTCHICFFYFGVRWRKFLAMVDKRLITLLSIIMLPSLCWASDGFRICFQETERSSQCQGPSSTCSGWSSSPAWSQPFRDDTDNREVHVQAGAQRHFGQAVFEMTLMEDLVAANTLGR